MDEIRIHEIVSQHMRKIEELTNQAGALFGFDVIHLSYMPPGQHPSLLSEYACG